MPNIKAIKNLTVYQDLDTNTEIEVNPRIFVQPDVCVVRCISYSAIQGDLTGNYLVWSDLTQDFIGTFALNTIEHINVYPQTMFTVLNPINTNSNIKFKIYSVENGNQQAAPISNELTGKISIQMDFITYK